MLAGHPSGRVFQQLRVVAEQGPQDRSCSSPGHLLHRLLDVHLQAAWSKMLSGPMELFLGVLEEPACLPSQYVHPFCLRNCLVSRLFLPFFIVKCDAAS